MRNVDIIIILLALAGILLLPYAAERNIADNCRKLGGFEVGGTVFKCREKTPKAQ